MSNEALDPRHIVMEEILYNERHEIEQTEAEAIARLDAADPRLAMWGEMVKALEDLCEEAQALTRRIKPDGWQGTYPVFASDVEDLEESLVRALPLRARALDATNQGGHHER